VIASILAALAVLATPVPSGPGAATASPPAAAAPATAAPSAAPSGAALPSATPIAAPSAAASPVAPSPAAEPAAPATPATLRPASAAPATAAGATIPYAYRFVPYPPKDANSPRIFAVYLNDKVLHALGPIDIRVDTSPDVVRVEEHTGKRSYAIPMTAPGRFISSGKLPKVPFIAHGIGVVLDFEAFDAAGRSTTVEVPFTIK